MRLKVLGCKAITVICNISRCHKDRDRWNTNGMFDEAAPQSPVCDVVLTRTETDLRWAVVADVALIDGREDQTSDFNARSMPE